MVTVKKYDPKQLDDVRQVCINTGPLEAATDPVMRKFILRTFCDYYCEMEPQNVYVLADENDTAQGYVFIAENFKLYSKNFKKYLADIKTTGKSNYFEVLGELALYGLLSKKYPAHLHIDINAPFRGNGNGSKMVQTQLENLRKKNVKGVMLIVGSNNYRGIKFYEKNGFRKYLTIKNRGTVMVREL